MFPSLKSAASLSLFSFSVSVSVCCVLVCVVCVVSLFLVVFGASSMKVNAWTCAPATASDLNWRKGRVEREEGKLHLQTHPVLHKGNFGQSTQSRGLRTPPNRNPTPSPRWNPVNLRSGETHELAVLTGVILNGPRQPQPQRLPLPPRFDLDRRHLDCHCFQCFFGLHVRVSPQR